MAAFLAKKKKRGGRMMMNAIGMFIVTGILQAWIPSRGLIQVTMTTGITATVPPLGPSCFLWKLAHFKPSRNL